MHRWISVNEETNTIKEFKHGRALARYYKTSVTTIYKRLEANNLSRSPIFGKNIKIYRLTGKFGDPIEKDELTNFVCDTCRTPVRSKDIICDKCDVKEKNAKVVDSIDNFIYEKIDMEGDDTNLNPVVTEEGVVVKNNPDPEPERQKNFVLNPDQLNELYKAMEIMKKYNIILPQK